MSKANEETVRECNGAYRSVPVRGERPPRLHVAGDLESLAAYAAEYAKGYVSGEPGERSPETVIWCDHGGATAVLDDVAGGPRAHCTMHPSEQLRSLVEIDRHGREGGLYAKGVLTALLRLSLFGTDKLAHLLEAIDRSVRVDVPLGLPCWAGREERVVVLTALAWDGATGLCSLHVLAGEIDRAVTQASTMAAAIVRRRLNELDAPGVMIYRGRY